MDCYLHIGTGKTGTTTIQRFLAENRAALLKHGCLVPQVPGRQRHVGLYLYALNDDRAVTKPAWRQLKHDSPAHFRAEFAKSFVAEIASSPAKMAVLSDEGLAGLKRDEVARLKQLLQPLFANIYVIIYLRRQDEHVVSSYLQSLARGSTKTLEQHLGSDLARSYDYYKKLRMWGEHFGSASLRPRLFDRGELANGTLTDDFLEAIDLAGTGPFADISNQNRSLGAGRARFVRWLNERVPQRAMLPLDGLRRRLIRHLAQTSTGDRLVLPEPVAEAFMEKWRASNAAVAREFFDRPDGELFRSVRR